MTAAVMAPASARIKSSTNLDAHHRRGARKDVLGTTTGIRSGAMNVLDVLATDTEIVPIGNAYALVIRITPDTLDALAIIGAELEDLEDGGEKEADSDAEYSLQPAEGPPVDVIDVLAAEAEDDLLKEMSRRSGR